MPGDDQRVLENEGVDGHAADNDREEAQPEPSPFPHPPWTVGVVLVLGVVSLLFGLLVRPIFLAVGSPFIIVLLLWLYVKLIAGGDAT
jgi:hypothetical protein